MLTKLSGLLFCIALYFCAKGPEFNSWRFSRNGNSPIFNHRTEGVMAELVRVKLTGGPDGTPTTWEVGSLEDESKIKILFGNCYEHFEYAHYGVQREGIMLPVYQWCYRTYVAE